MPILELCWKTGYESNGVYDKSIYTLYFHQLGSKGQANP